MATFRPAAYSSAVAALIDSKRLNDLGPGTPNQPVRSILEGLHVDDLFDGRAVVDRDMAACCLSGLWLFYDHLEESHALSQSVHTATGSYWHGIMHRREHDFGNSKYWFRKVGQHPIFPSLHEVSRRTVAETVTAGRLAYLIEQTSWDPLRFVDLCQQLRGGSGAEYELCQRVAQSEWQLLFDYCYCQAVRRP